MTAGEPESTAGESATADDLRLRRNRLIFGIVVAPIGVLIALFLSFVVQISYAWRSTSDGGAAAGPQIVAIVIGLLATVPALIAGIRALRDRVLEVAASGATVVAGLGFVAVVLLVVVPAFDVLPRAAREADAYQEQQRLDELDDVDSGFGPGSAEEAGQEMQEYVDDALRLLEVAPSAVRTSTWSTSGTTAAGNTCRAFHERIRLGDEVDRSSTAETLRTAWKAEGDQTGFDERNGRLELSVSSADATISWLKADNVLLVESDCIPSGAP
ncbi:hypothetical protein BJK06_14995 [Curtobacterium sp. BH-2-1-1]|uniref:hypothetical protein n=1 Tax=Curtobacterium sp. BH-2-1-1 TaxID=1905847 RepID=UPI00089E0416|nr:hypothetical protein [Curtobacterium sp. BH-2-1-1]AOX66851.1 hypothetical protein BJK06_14995 [Curtobacterium sp. BH-2-1-1]